MKFPFLFIFIFLIISSAFSVLANPLPANPSPPETELKDFPLFFIYNLIWNTIIMLSGVILIFSHFKEKIPSLRKILPVCILITLSGLIIDYFFVNEQIYWIWIHLNKFYSNYPHEFLYDYTLLFMALFLIGTSVFLISKYFLKSMNKINFAISLWFVALNFFIWLIIIYLDYSPSFPILNIIGFIVLPFIITLSFFYRKYSHLKFAEK